MKTATISKELNDKFLDLLCQMSPENLTCDGELSPAQVNARSRSLAAQWAVLERKAGRSVTESEVRTNYLRSH